MQNQHSAWHLSFQYFNLLPSCKSICSKWTNCYTPLLNLGNKIYQQETCAGARHGYHQDSVKHWGKNCSEGFWRYPDNAPVLLTAVYPTFGTIAFNGILIVMEASDLLLWVTHHLFINQSINQLFFIGKNPPCFPSYFLHSSRITMGTKLNWLKMELCDFLLALKCK